MLYLLLALTCCTLMVVLYLLFRDSRLSVADSFFFFFLLQYGPHSLFLTSFNELASNLSTETEQKFLLGMSLTYACLTFVLASTAVFKRSSPSENPIIQLSDRSLFLPIAVAVANVIFFAAIQGLSLPITSEYLRGLSGTSFFDYSDIRRELFSDTLYVRVASLTRQTTTALLFSWLMTRVRPFRLESILPLTAAGFVFIVCAMQMNKFPFVYFILLAAITLYQDVTTESSTNPTRQLRWLLPVAGIVCVGLLFFLYRVQYRDSTVSVDRLNRVPIYRILFCSSDALRLWFDFFPDSHPFLGMSANPATAALVDVPPVNATVLIPDSYGTPGKTSFQCGFIASGYAVAGYWGIAVYSLMVGLLVGIGGWWQRTDRGDMRWQPFWNVLLLNMFFFSTRELQTAFLSGGTASVLLLLLIFKKLPRVAL